jgi:predicted metalloprotease with PDZ domain
MQNLIADLSKKYGKAQAFKDEELFDQITALTYPEIGEFLKRHVGGSERLPLPEIFESVGITYTPEITTQEFTTGLETRAMKVTPHNGRPSFQIANPAALNDQGKALNFQTGDILLTMNGQTFPDLGPDLQPFFDKQKQAMKEGEKLTYTVLRTSENSEAKEVTLEATIKKIERKKKHNLEVNANASPEQLTLRNYWLSIK